MNESSSPENNLLPSNQPQEFHITAEQTAKLHQLGQFIDQDKQIKNQLRAAAYPIGPNELGAGDTESYRHHLISSAKTLKNSFSSLSSNMKKLGLDGNSISSQSQIISDDLIERITPAENNNDFNSLERAFKFYISSLRSDFAREVSTEIIGYYTYRNLYFKNLAQKANSFNELLHLAHSALIADETLFKKLPQWGDLSIPSKWIEYRAYGQPNEIAQNIFSHFQQNANNFLNHPHSSPIKEIPNLLHLFSVDQTIHLMVRDFGHATTIEIDTSKPQSAAVEYHIPRIYDGLKVNQLPGVNRVKPLPGKHLDTGTFGGFSVPYSEIGQKIVDFIQKIPTDSNH